MFPTISVMIPVCDDSSCEPIVDGAVFLYDHFHLTATRALSLTTALTEYIVDAIPTGSD